MSPKFISPVSALLALAFAGNAGAQVVIPDDVNQIQGTVSFTNAGPLAEPLSQINLSSSSIGLSTTRYASTTATLSGNSGTYALTVISTGLTHNVSANAYFDSNRDYYSFPSQVSPAVPNEPAPAVTVDFAECAGFASFEFYDAATNAPISLEYASAYAYPQVSPGSFSGSYQASTADWTTAGESFAVRGDGNNYKIDVHYKVGLFTFLHSEERVIDCDQAAQPIRIPIEEGLPFEPGAIDGYVDLRFLSEQADTYMYAVGGPASHWNYDTVGGSPAQGPFLIESLVPSDFVSPSDPYSVYTSMHFDTGVNVQSFSSEAIEVTVPPGGTAPTGNAFIMNAGYMEGDVGIRGPLRCANAASQVHRYLSGTSGGGASADLTYSVNPDPLAEPGMRELGASYLLAVGVPNDLTRNWTPGYFGRFYDGTPTPAAYQDSYYYYTDYAVGSPAIAPTTSQTVDVNHCTSFVSAHVYINGQNNVGSVFNNPRVWFGGANSDGVNYGVSGYASGTPLSSDARDVQGYVNMCIPAGTYTFDATVSAQADTGEVSETQLKQVVHDIPCGAVVNPLVVHVDADPVCKGETAADVEVTAKGLLQPEDVHEMFAVFNCTEDDVTACSPRIAICGGSMPACGTDPTQGLTIPANLLNSCGNTVHVVAIDSATESVSISASSPFAVESITGSGQGCADVIAQYDGGLGGGRVSLDDVIIWDECGMEADATFCKFSNGSGSVTSTGADVILPGGSYTGQCKVKTECGTRTCAFNATVVD